MEHSAAQHDVPDSADDAALPCPGCGYDLRGTAGERCSECGMVIDRAALRVSAFPWAHRREIGRVRGYWKTVWQVTMGSRKVRWEWAKPQSVGDARRFRWVTAVLAAIGLMGVYVFEWFAEPAEAWELFLATSPGGWERAWMQDLAVPWSAGISIPFMLPVLLLAVAWWMADVRPLFKLAGGSAQRREAAEAVANYSTAGLAWLPAVPVALLLDLLARSVEPLPFVLAARGMMAVAIVVGLTAVLGPLVGVGVWVRRVKRSGWGGAVLGSARLLGRWLLGVVILLGIIPWSIGFMWIVIDSFR